MSTILVRHGKSYYRVKVNPDGINALDNQIEHVKSLRDQQEHADDDWTKLNEILKLLKDRYQRLNEVKSNPAISINTIEDHIVGVRYLRDKQVLYGKTWNKLNSLLKDLEAQHRQLRHGRLASAIRIGRRALSRNPLLKSPHMKHVSANIAYLMKHPEELTAKTKEGKRKQAIAIALSVMQRAQKTQKNPAGRVMWFLVAGKHWITAIAQPGESPRDALARTYLHGNRTTQLTVTKPDGVTPSEWDGMICNHSVYHPEHTTDRKNPAGWSLAFLLCQRQLWLRDLYRKEKGSDPGKLTIKQMATALASRP